MKHLSLTKLAVANGILLFCLIIQIAYLVSPFHTRNKGDDQTAQLNTIQKEWFKKMDVVGSSKTYSEFKEKVSHYPFSQQHNMAHMIGDVLYAHEGLKGVTICDPSFAFGCYHSFFARSIKANGLSVIYKLDRECVKDYGTKGLGCNHGIGHGILYEMGKERLVDALTLCSTLSWKGDLGGCTSGVFMEYNLNTMNNPNAERTAVRAPTNDLLSPCDSVPQKYRIACYFEMPQWWTILFDHTTVGFSKAGTLCDSIPDQSQKAICYKGIGNIAAPTTHYSIAETQHLCNALQAQDGILLCMAGASWSFSSSPEHKSDAAQVCESALVQKSLCRQEAGII
jgi:hypothetical protein